MCPERWGSTVFVFYERLISHRLTCILLFDVGKLKTAARFIREFVQNHPDYKQDSVVSESINYDLLKKCANISLGMEKSPLLPDLFNSKTADAIPQAMSKAEGYLNQKNPHTYQNRINWDALSHSLLGIYSKAKKKLFECKTDFTQHRPWSTKLFWIEIVFLTSKYNVLCLQTDNCL